MSQMSRAIIGYDKEGPLFDSAVIRDGVAIDLAQGHHCTNRIKMNMTPDYERAAEAAEGLRKMFNASTDQLMKSVESLAATSKATSSTIRKTGNELHESMQRLEKLANVDRLERQVLLLERAAKALQALAELEKDGHLSRITGALK